MEDKSEITLGDFGKSRLHTYHEEYYKVIRAFIAHLVVDMTSPDKNVDYHNFSENDIEDWMRCNIGKYTSVREVVHEDSHWSEDVPKYITRVFRENFKSFRKRLRKEKIYLHRRTIGGYHWYDRVYQVSLYKYRYRRIKR
jgi:hypothetical protein